MAPRDRDERHRLTDTTTIHDMTTTATTTILATTHPPYMERTERVRTGVDGVYRSVLRCLSEYLVSWWYGVERD